MVCWFFNSFTNESGFMNLIKLFLIAIVRNLLLIQSFGLTERKIVQISSQEGINYEISLRTIVPSQTINWSAIIRIMRDES